MATEQREWQPIETALDDGTPILLYSKYEEVGIGFFWRNDWHWYADGCAVIEYQSDCGTEYKRFAAPTRWMHRPDPPTESEDAADAGAGGGGR